MHGYSSSEESEDYRCPRTPPTSTNNNDQKKKKKKKAPPQQSINRTWKKFQNKKFSKALAVLPFDPVLPSASADKPNEQLSAGYDRAVEECRRRVKKIIQECRRVNMRYRDPGWDLDWDLKYEKGHCLNSLGCRKWQLCKKTLSNPSASVPKAVKRVHEIFEKPTFMKNPSGSDVKQGSLGDCWLMASLTALANVQDGLKRICVEYDTRIGIYGFVFYRDGEWIYSIIDDKLYLKSPCWDSPSMQRDLLQQIDREDVERVYRKTYQTGSKALFFAQCKDQNETWVPLLEKAYAKAHGDYASLVGGWIGEGLEDLSGGVTTELLTSDILDIDGFWDNELSKVNDEFLFGCSTGLLDGGYGEREGISEGHAYVIMEARTLKCGERLIKLRNPWGKIRKGLWEGAWSDGSKEWTTEVQEELGHQFGSDSVFWINYEDFLCKYQHIDKTRLFRDPAWRCTQRWISVEVPWKSHFNEKFQIKLSKDGPLVLVLSQLDERYFRGLQGQYTFRIHFRVHERSRPGSEDYIVRSHGNYLMERSVSIELPDMPAGEYSIFMSVDGERNRHLPSVEDVVKRECEKRSENEKLAQVGAAYDLAHSKGTAHLEEVARLRKIKEREKASNSRKLERRKEWERRHINREIKKKQKLKNKEKRNRKIALAQEEAMKAQAAARAAAEAAALEAAELQSTAAEAERKTDEEGKEEAQTPKEKPNDQGVQTETTKEDAKEATAVPSETTPSETVTSNETSDAVEGPGGEEKADAPTPDDVSSEDNCEDSSEDANEDNSKESSKDEAENGSIMESKENSKQEAEKTSNEETPVESKDEAEQKAEVKPKEASEETSNEGDSAESKDEAKEKSEEKPEGASEETSDKDESAEESERPNQRENVPRPPPPPPPPPAAVHVHIEDDDSSDSPVEDWEDPYSSDDMIKRPRSTPPGPRKKYEELYEESDDDDLPDPWNAICVVGVRVYSMDEDLELRVVMEGGELLEGGMGKKGEADIDNAQVNAGGEREKPKSEETDEAAAAANEPAETQERSASNDSSIEKKEDENKQQSKQNGEEIANCMQSSEDSKSERSADSAEYDKLDSGATTPEIIATPEPTPMDSNKELC